MKCKGQCWHPSMGRHNQHWMRCTVCHHIMPSGRTAGEESKKEYLCTNRVLKDDRNTDYCHGHCECIENTINEGQRILLRESIT